MVGARARVKNSDSVLHNTHGFHVTAEGAGKQTVFNLALPSAGQVIDITKKLSRPGPVRVLCDAHPHMFAWVYVHDSPYVAVTDERGAFRIAGVPRAPIASPCGTKGSAPEGSTRTAARSTTSPRGSPRK